MGGILSVLYQFHHSFLYSITTKQDGLVAQKLDKLDSSTLIFVLPKIGYTKLSAGDRVNMAHGLVMLLCCPLLSDKSFRLYICIRCYVLCRSKGDFIAVGTRKHFVLP